MNPQTSGPVSYNSSSSGRNNILVLVILVILLIGALAFGGWAFKNMQDYKNNSDKKAAIAVEEAKKTQAVQLQTEFTEQSKSPYKTFHGSPTYGSVTFNYPKSWSAYIDSSNTSQPINGYFHPGEVPGTQSKTAYALRVELLNTDYSQLVQQYNSQITQGMLSAKAYVPPKMKNEANTSAGTYLSGQVNTDDQDQRGYLVIIKVRDKTLKIYTDSKEFQKDFDNIVLASLKFAP
jgi:hypothetical protein